MGQRKREPKYQRIVLVLSDLEHSWRAVPNSFVLERFKRKHMPKILYLWMRFRFRSL
jgi:hypothetical protein